MALLTTPASPAAGAARIGELPPDLQRALAKVTEISSLPEVATKITQVVEDPRATARQIHDIVQSDPALAARILKIVNSAFYGLPSQIASLERAILMLGLSAVRNLALAASVSRLVKEGSVCGEFSTRDLWRHSVAVGVCAKLLAGATKCAQADEAFVAGLVHDMGLIVVQQLFPAKMKAVAERCLATPQNFCAAEIELIGADHQAFGGALATKWKFPTGLRYAIAYHHEPSSLQAEFQKVAALIYLADAVCCRARYGFYLSAQTHEFPDWMLKLTGLSVAQLTAVTEELPDRMTEAEQIFGAD